MSASVVTTQINIDRKVFNKVYLPHLNNTSRTQIFYGGSSSGKSVFLAQRAVYDVLQGKRNYLVCRQVGRTVRKSVFNEIEKVIADWGLRDLFDVNKSEFTITCENGSQILFSGLDDVEKIKSIIPRQGVITDIWIEEATETERETIKGLYKRQRGGSDDTPKRLTLSFNPIYKTHWIYLEHFATTAWADDQTTYSAPELSIQKTIYKDNRFLTDADKADLENEKDEYFYNVYTLGNWGILGDIIFKNWRVEDLSGMAAQFTNHRNGLDFGFSSDPAAMPVTHYDRNHQTIYVYDELYERGLTNDVLAQEITKRIDKQFVTCDSAEPKSIFELQSRGINAIAARKGKDSVNFGIQWLQQQTIVIDSKCLNARAEMSVYHWKQDKDGNAIRQPVDKMNHLIDGLRYAYEDDMGVIVMGVANPFYD
jgi:phage terminase large subunit